LADLVRTDRHNHRPVAADSDLAEAIKALARAHQSMVWARRRQANQLRSTLREFYPAALAAFDDLASGDALAVLRQAPQPALGAALSRTQITAAVQAALRASQLQPAPALATAMGAAVTALVGVITEMNTQISALETQLAADFEQHPDAEVARSLPGLGTILGARVPGESGDAPGRYATAKSRKNYAGTSPVTKTSGRSRVVHARHSRNKRLADALDQWAFCSTNWSPGANAYCDELKSRGKHHRKATRQLANKWVGILHACLENGTLYDEEIAWPTAEEIAA
jgi:transposase